MALFIAQHAVCQDTILLSIELSSFDIVELEEKDPLNDYYQGNRFGLTESALERIPAVSLVSRGNFAPEPTYRGFSSGQLNLTIDGMHIFSACTDKMDPVSSYVETNNLASVSAGNENELNSNGAGLGGCIDMKTAKPDLSKEKIYGHLASGYNGISNGFNASGGIGFNNKNISGVFSGTYRNNDTYKDGNGDVVDYTQFNKTNFSAKLVSNFSSFQRIKFDFIYDRAWDVGYAALPMDVSLAEATIYSMTYERFYFGKGLKSFEIKAYGNSIKHVMDDSKRPNVPIRMDMPGWSDTYGAFSTFKWQKIKGHHFQLKADGFIHYALAEMTMYPNDEAPMYMLTWPDIQRIVFGLFLADDWTIKDGFQLKYSLRYDHSNSRLQSEFAKDHLRIFGYDMDDPINIGTWNALVEPKWKINESWQLSWIAALKQRIPTVSEQYGFFLFNALDGYDYMGNPELDKESALQGEMTVSYEKKSLGFYLSAFYYDIDNYIVGVVDPDLSSMTIGANGVKVYQAIDNAYMTGFEASLFWNTKRFNWVNVVNYTFGRDMNGEILPQLPPLRLTSTFSYKLKNLEIIPELVGALAKNEVRTSFGEKSSPAWMIANLRASYLSKKNKQWRIQGGIENLFNEYYSEFLDWGQIPRPGRNFYINLSYRF